jgi:hypothetical protein
LSTTLPRVTYSNVRADFAGVHNLLDTCIPAFRQAMLGKAWPNRIDGRDDTGGACYEAPCPIDRRIVLGRFHAADAAAIDRAALSPIGVGGRGPSASRSRAASPTSSSAASTISASPA